MPLEDLTGAKYIDSLNSNWPINDDRLQYADDHLRGIKNVLKQCFPNVTGPVTRSHTSLSNGTMPVGTKTIFYQAAPPSGWTRVTGIDATHLLRIITTANTTDGGSAGGTDDPVLNDKAPAHTHPSVVATTSSNATSHTHAISLTTGSSGAHTHTIPIGGTVSGSPPLSVPAAALQYVISPAPVIDTSGASANHTHSVSGTSGATKPDHTHTVSVAIAANTATNWVPRYLNVILCERTS